MKRPKLTAPHLLVVESRVRTPRPWYTPIARSPHWVEFIGGAAAVLLVGTWHAWTVPWTVLVPNILGGATFFTLAEYAFHRFLFHRGPLVNSHDNHHRHPTKLRILMTPLIPAYVGGALLLLTFRLLGYDLRNGIFIGYVLGYVAFETIHLLCHRGGGGSATHAVRSYHALHHRVRNHNFGYGVSTPCWDLIFGTLPAPWSDCDTWPPYATTSPTLRLWVTAVSLISIPFVSFWLLTPHVPPARGVKRPALAWDGPAVKWPSLAAYCAVGALCALGCLSG